MPDEHGQSTSTFGRAGDVVVTHLPLNLLGR